MLRNVYILLFIFLFLFCTQLDNPFADHSNAKMHIISNATTFETDNSDSALIFTSETLTVAAAVHELIDSFSVSASDNRYWETRTVVNPTPESYRFIISFIDTGDQTVTIKTYRTNGDNDIQNIILKVKNPLFMDDISRYNFADTITLSCRSVGDKDGVVYNWLFGYGGQLIQSPFSTTNTSITSANNVENTGYLWVSDSSYQSPVVSFNYSFFDSTPPAIICVNDNYDKNLKTITTPDSIFSFMVRVTDRGNQSVGSVKINGEQPDFKRLNVYTSVISNTFLYNKDNPLKITVYAVDNNEYSNDTTETFSVIFDKNAISRGATTIKISNITDSTLTTSQNNLYIFGTAENTSNHMILLSLFLNGQIISDTAFRGYGYWNSFLALHNGANDFHILAKDSAGSLLDSQYVHFYLNTSLIDTTPPVIISTECDDQQITDQEIYNTVKDFVRIRITAFDKESGISKLLINNDTITPTDNDYRLTYTMHPILHKVNTVFFRLIDMKGNYSSDTISITRNNPPAFTMNNTIPYVVYLGKTYTDTIHFSDNDNDSVVLHILSKPRSMSIDNSGIISWTPQNDDAGEGLSFQLKDGFSTTISGYYDYIITDSTKLSPHIHISDSISIPQYLEAGRDSLNALIRIAPESGKPPFKFSVSIMNRSVTILDSSTDSLIRWFPSQSDTGIAELQIIAEDSFRFSDTLYRTIEIIRSNSDPATLSWSSSVDTNRHGELPVGYITENAHILFTIHDSDDPRTEAHRIQIRSASVNSSVIAEKDTFSVIITPLPGKYSDTLYVNISDNTGGTDNVIIPLRFVTTPDHIAGLYSWNTDSSIQHQVVDIDKFDTWNSTFADGFTFKNSNSGTIYTLDNAVNGHDAVRFNDENGYIFSALNGVLFDTAFTVFFTARYDSTTPSNVFQTLISSADYGTIASRSCGFGIGSDGTVSLFTRLGLMSAWSAEGSNLKLVKNRWHAVSFSTTGVSNDKMSLDISVDNMHDTISDAPACSEISLIIGNSYLSSARPTVIYPFFGQIAEIIIFNRVLSRDESSSVEQYLTSKFNLGNQ